MKTVFKVSELHHAFFNGIALNGAKAGALAVVIGRTLSHNGQVPAASFLSDATATDGRQVAAIFPQYHDNESRWTVRELQSAIPAAQVAEFQVQAWPRHEPQRGDVALAESVAIIVANQFDAIERDCMASISSVADCEGEKPLRVPRYVATIRDALALVWTDTIARHEASRKLATIRDKWQLSETGEFDLSIVRAIAQRAAVQVQASEALPKLRGYFTERASLSRLQDKIAFCERQNRNTLQRAIASVMRAGVPDGERFPPNMLAAIHADFAAVARVDRIRQAPRAVRHGWNAYAHARNLWQVADQAKRSAADENMPARFRSEFAAIAKFNTALSHRAGHKADISRLLTAIVASESARQVVQNTDVESVADADVNAVIIDCGRMRAAMNETMNSANNVAVFAPKHPRLQSEPVAWLHDESARESLATKAKDIADSLRDRAKRAARASTVANFRAELSAIMETAATTPRMARGQTQSMRYRLTGWNAADNFGDALQELATLTDESIATIRTIEETVTPLQEWRNGGDAPGNGDWLRVNGSRATTNRGVTVSTRAIVAALAWLDSQASQVVSNAGQKIDGYTLTSRNADGTVRVGCHTFYADSVADIRAQVAA